jgi:hypothetical protein
VLDDELEIKAGDPAPVLEGVRVQKFNLIVLTQACDLVGQKLSKIVLCPYFDAEKVAEGKPGWLEGVRKGRIFHKFMLLDYEGEHVTLPRTIVDFHQIYSLPRTYLEKHAGRIEHRLRLLPPYREALGQAFARYFMRVGLPEDIPPLKS